MPVLGVDSAPGNGSSPKPRTCGVDPVVEILVLVPGRPAGQAVAKRVDDIDQVARARVVTDGLHDQPPPCGITERAQPGIDRVVVRMAQVGEPEVGCRLIQLRQNLLRSAHWLTPVMYPSPHPPETRFKRHGAAPVKPAHGCRPIRLARSRQ